jgi:glycogen operon protein
VRAARALRKRNLLATLFLAQGTPMLLAGDELGNSQGGNNNAYAQDNETGWVQWGGADAALTAFVARLTALRRAHPVLRQRRFLHARARPKDGLPDVIWRRADGRAPQSGDWHDPAFRCLGMEVRGAAEDGGEAVPVFLVFNAGGEVPLVLPGTALGWQLELDTSDPEAPPGPWPARRLVPAQSVLVFTALDRPATAAAAATAAPGAPEGRGADRSMGDPA